MRYDSGQFGSFDGLDNRRDVMHLFKRLGEHLPPHMANQKRAEFLQSLIKFSGNGFASRMIQMQAATCDTVGAYNAFVAITGVLGVEINAAARLLEEAVRKQ